MVHVVATIDLVPGKRAAFLEEMRKLVPLVHAEEGCIEYTPTMDVASGHPAQPALRENTVIVVEKWASLAALHAHLAAPHMADYRMRVKDFVIGVQLEVLESAV